MLLYLYGSTSIIYLLNIGTPDGLSLIASAIGRPMMVDKMTSACQRISFARIFIEVDAEFELLKTLDIEIEDLISRVSKIITLNIEYLWAPSRGVICKHFGYDCSRILQP